MKRLNQELNTYDDSFIYTVFGEVEPIYVVNSSGYLITGKGVEIGQFKLRNNQWHLYLSGELYRSGPPDGLHKLPEFELKVLTELVNR